MSTNPNHPNNITDNAVRDSATIAADKAPFSASLGSLMKSWRTTANRSVYSVAKATGLSAHTINRIESGHAVNLEAALRYLAFINRTDSKNDILRDYLAVTKSIELTPRQPRAYPTTEVSTTGEVAASEAVVQEENPSFKNDEPVQKQGLRLGLKNMIKGLFYP